MSVSGILPWRGSEDLPRIEHRREAPGGDMQRRGESGQSVKDQRAARSKARKAPVNPPSTDNSAEQFDRLRRERDEALEQLAATSEVLKVISSSPGDLTPVFDAILEHATRLCEATHGHVWRFDGEQLHAVSVRGDPKFVEWLRQHNPVRPAAGSAADRIVRGERFEHMADRRAEDAYRDNQTFRGFVDACGIRTSLAVALRKGETLLGMINVYRQEVRPFTDKQIELVQNFAAQAVIAIENARLLNELRQRTGDLSEALDQQTATSEVLKVISSSPGELEPVFQVVLENATRICEAKFGVLFRYENGAFYAAAMLNAPQAFVEFHRQRGSFTPPAGTPLDRLLSTGDTIYTADEASEPNPGAPARFGGARSLVTVPMRKENKLVGAIIIYRQEIRPFTGKQIELLTNFAAQAVIAIENTRLLNELRESLQQQTATADVLKTISSSTGQLEPVFNAMLENAVRICGAKFGSLVLFEGNAYRRAALHNAPAAFVKARAREPVLPLAASPILSRVAGTKQVIQFADIAAEHPEEPIATLGGARTILSAPMLNDDRVVGVISIYRQEVRPFTDKQIELVKNLAAQAVIAIENTRLLNELRETLERQTATSEVLEVISSSPGELQPIFDTMLAKASELCEASYGLMWLSEGDAFRTAALHGDLPQAYVDLWRSGTLFRPGPHVLLSRVAISGQPLQVSDLRTDASYLSGDPMPVAAADIAGVRTLLAVPMIRDERVVGAIGIYRKGEGTGLGLSISHDIIVKQHGGSIEVDTQSGEFTEIRIILPRTAVFLAESDRR
jgi:GAF domain-containing protein